MEVSAGPTLRKRRSLSIELGGPVTAGRFVVAVDGAGTAIGFPRRLS